MNDLVSYNQKHNLDNGEENRDGDNHNHNCNYGVEGPTDRSLIDDLRKRHIKNLLTSILVSQGVPMLVAGDEFRRTQNGNNNAYCQDNEISWLDWKLVQENQDLVRFTKSVIQFRKSQPALRKEFFLTGKSAGPNQLPDVSWYGPVGTAVDWQSGNQMTCLLTAQRQTPAGQQGRDILMMFNSSQQGCQFALPVVAEDRQWQLFIDTSEPSPKDVYPEMNGPYLTKGESIVLPGRTMMLWYSDAN